MAGALSRAALIKAFVFAMSDAATQTGRNAGLPRFARKDENI
jgi:hypothetical protein